MRIPGKAELVDLQESFGELFRSLDAKPGMNLLGNRFDNSGDSVSLRSLVTLAQVTKLVSRLKAEANDLNARRDITGDVLGDLLGFRTGYLTTSVGTFNNITLLDLPGLAFDVLQGEVWAAIALLCVDANVTHGVRVAVKPAGAPTFGAPLVPTPGFSPSDIPGLTCWLKADSIAGLSDGDPVTTWTDQSGGGHSFTQATPGARPIYKTNVINGKPVVRFDGTNDFMNGPLISDVMTVDFGTIFVVYKATSGTVVGTNDPPGSHVGIIQENPTQAKFQLLDSSAYRTLLVPAPFQQWHVALWTHGLPTPNILYGGIDGSSPLVTSVGAKVVLIPPPALMSLGAVANASGLGGSVFLNGDITEIIMYSSGITGSQRRDLEAYLSDKYDLKLSYDPHIFLTSPSSGTYTLGGLSYEPGTPIGIKPDLNGVTFHLVYLFCSQATSDGIVQLQAAQAAGPTTLYNTSIVAYSTLMAFRLQ